VEGVSVSDAAELRAAARSAREAANLAHAISIVNARTELAEQAQDVEDAGKAFARIADRLAAKVRAHDKQRQIEECEHAEVMDDRLVPDTPLTTGTCSACGQLICWSCKHRVGQHGEMGCRIEGCDCSRSHK
jgi:hypothetical protein